VHAEDARKDVVRREALDEREQRDLDHSEADTESDQTGESACRVRPCAHGGQRQSGKHEAEQEAGRKSPPSNQRDRCGTAGKSAGRPRSTQPAWAAGPEVEQLERADDDQDVDHGLNEHADAIHAGQQPHGPVGEHGV
jgi:hypothetical protein